jgi:curved DNA-binding protein CbpA
MNYSGLYSILGVLPDADEVVIKAAYRALAQRYHPDKWSGDPAEAHARMAALNEAFRVLGDPALRAEYDSKQDRTEKPTFETAYDVEQDRAFSEALSEVEQRWAVAVSVYPDLADRRATLARISTQLAFSYVSTLLSTKQIQHREALASDDWIPGE